MATGYTATGSHFDKDISAQDKNAISALQQQYAAAKGQGAPQSHLDSLHQQAESIRKQYGYSGGTDGSEYLKLETQEPVKSGIAAGTSQAAYLNSLYKAQQEAALSKLKAAYEQNMIDVNAAGVKIPQTYQAARNQTAATAEQNRAAFNEQAAAYGLNSGTGGQASLAMANQNAANMSALNSQEANALTDLETTRLKLSTAYQNDIAQAIAQGDIARAQALYGEAVRVDNSLIQQSMAQADENYRYWSTNQNQQLQMAETLAQFGDFSGYLAMGYTPERVENMKRVWDVMNPKVSGYGAYSGGAGSYAKEKEPDGGVDPDFGKPANASPSAYSGAYSIRGTQVLAEAQAMQKQGAPSSVIINQVHGAMRSGAISPTDASRILDAVGL